MMDGDLLVTKRLSDCIVRTCVDQRDITPTWECLTLFVSFSELRTFPSLNVAPKCLLTVSVAPPPYAASFV